MFRAMLVTQFRWARFPLLLLSLAGFAIPLLSLSQVSQVNWNPQTMMDALATFGVLYPILAGASGLILAVTAWTSDHRGRHVYALSLPLPRWHYVLLRMGAGAVLLLAPTIGVGLGAHLAALTVVLPAGLHAYPTILTLRFGLASLLAFALFFAVSAGTSKTAGYVLGAIAVVVLVQVAADSLEWNVHILEPVLYRLYIWPGPLEIFVGHWMLFDV